MEFPLRRYLLPLLAALSFITPAMADIQRLNLSAVRATEPPKIDGDLSDACWREAPEVRDFYFLPDGTKADEPTSAWVCYDSRNIYVAFSCKDSQPDKIVAQQTKRGGSMGMDDRVEIDIDCFGNANGNQVAWFQMTSRGTQRERLQSGDVSKIEWKGDWYCATKRPADGYTVEAQIPFSILQYDSKSPKMHIMLARHNARLAKWWIAPNLGPTGDARLYYQWAGVQPPVFRNRPLILTHSVISDTDTGRTGRFGGDIKYAFTPELTGTATLRPDFSNIEQQVETVNFAYAERYLPDSRPFFQEGSSYLPGSDLLYTTTRFNRIDYGGKITGGYGGFNIGLLNLNQRDDAGCTAVRISRDLGGKGQLGIAEVGSLSGAHDAATQLTGNYLLYERGDRRLNISSGYTAADVVYGSGQRHAYNYGLSYGAGTGAWTYSIGQSVIDDGFAPRFGLLGETNLRSTWAAASIYSEPSKGSLRNWSLSTSLISTDHLDGSKFYDSLSLGTSFTWRKGFDLSTSVSSSDRPPFRDNVFSFGHHWGRKTLYRRGGIDASLGRVAGGSYLYWTASQSRDLSSRLSLKASYEYARINKPSPSAYSLGQWIVTATYDLDTERSIAGRLVQRGGDSIPYLAYRQRVRSGLDAYVILGDPNQSVSRTPLVVKLVRPM